MTRLYLDVWYTRRKRWHVLMEDREQVIGTYRIISDAITAVHERGIEDFELDVDGVIYKCRLQRTATKER